ncbi:hypothetical protein ACQY0O_007478 [Thecaphora frezii]
MTLMGPSGASARPNDAARVEIFGPRGLRALIRTTLTLCYSKLSGKYVVHELGWLSQQQQSGSTAGTSKLPPSMLDEPVRPIPNLPLHESELLGRDIPMDLASASWPRFTSFKAHGQSPRVHISAAPITHRCPTLGYTFEEDWGPSPLDPTIPELLNANAQALLDERNIHNPLSLLPRLVQERESILLPDGTMLHPPPLDLPGRKVTVLGDTSDATGGFDAETMGFTRGMAALAQGSDVLVHESTNIALPGSLTRDGKPESTAQAMAKAAERGHSTPQGAGAFAALIGAGSLILNHFSVRYPSPPYYLRGKSNDASTDGQGNADRRDGGGTEAPGPKQLSEPERRMQVMRQFEIQAADSWRVHLATYAKGDTGTVAEPKVVASYDGFVYDVPARPRVVTKHAPFSRAGEAWHEAGDSSGRSGKKAGLASHAPASSATRYKAKADEWDPSPYLLDHVAHRDAHAVVLLNSPIGDEQKHHFARIWATAKYRFCADGAANRLVDTFGYDRFFIGASDPVPRPHAIVGDLDSVRPEVKEFFQSQGVDILLRPSQYATDLQKCIQVLEDYERMAQVASELVLLIYGGLSGRLDQSVHTLHVLWQLAQGAADLGGVEDPDQGDAADQCGGKLKKRRRTFVIGDGSVAWLLTAGQHRLRMSRAVMGKTCGILPLGSGHDGARVTTKGLEWNLTGEQTTLGGFLSTSNHLADAEGAVELETDGAVYWTVELQ